MNNFQNNLNQALDLMIESKLKKQEENLNRRIEELEKKIQTANFSHNEILQQKEVFEILGIGRRKLKKWIERGLLEMRIDNRVYYRYSDIIQFIENGNK